MITLKIVIDEKAPVTFQVFSDEASANPTAAERVLASITHHALRAAHEEISFQMAEGELVCDTAVIKRLTRRPQ